MRIRRKTDLKTETSDEAHTEQRLLWPRIHLLVLPFAPRKYHHNVLELLHLLQNPTTYLQRALIWDSGETSYLCLFSVDFHPSLVARSRKPTKCVLKTLFRRCKQFQIVRKSKQLILQLPTVILPTSIRLWLQEEWRQHTPLSESKPNGERLLFNFPETSVNARWGQPWLIQPQNLPKQVSNWMLLYAMFLQLKGWNLKQIWCFQSSWLLFLVSWIPTKTWMWTNSGYQLPSLFSNEESVKLSKGVNCVVYWWWMQRKRARKQSGGDANLLLPNF